MTKPEKHDSESARPSESDQGRIIAQFPVRTTSDPPLDEGEVTHFVPDALATVLQQGELFLTSIDPSRISGSVLYEIDLGRVHIPNTDKVNTLKSLWSDDWTVVNRKGPMEDQDVVDLTRDGTMIGRYYAAELLEALGSGSEPHYEENGDIPAFLIAPYQASEPDGVDVITFYNDPDEHNFRGVSVWRSVAAKIINDLVVIENQDIELGFGWQVWESLRENVRFDNMIPLPVRLVNAVGIKRKDYRILQEYLNGLGSDQTISDDEIKNLCRNLAGVLKRKDSYRKIEEFRKSIFSQAGQIETSSEPVNSKTEIAVFEAIQSWKMGKETSQSAFSGLVSVIAGDAAYQISFSDNPETPVSVNRFNRTARDFWEAQRGKINDFGNLGEIKEIRTVSSLALSSRGLSIEFGSSDQTVIIFPDELTDYWKTMNLLIVKTDSGEQIPLIQVPSAKLGKKSFDLLVFPGTKSLGTFFDVFEKVLLSKSDPTAKSEHQKLFENLWEFILKNHPVNPTIKNKIALSLLSAQIAYLQLHPTHHSEDELSNLRYVLNAWDRFWFENLIEEEINSIIDDSIHHCRDYFAQEEIINVSDEKIGTRFDWGLRLFESILEFDREYPLTESSFYITPGSKDGINATIADATFENLNCAQLLCILAWKDAPFLNKLCGYDISEYRKLVVEIFRQVNKLDKKQVSSHFKRNPAGETVVYFDSQTQKITELTIIQIGFLDENKRPKQLSDRQLRDELNFPRYLYDKSCYFILADGQYASLNDLVGLNPFWPLSTFDELEQKAIGTLDGHTPEGITLHKLKQPLDTISTFNGLNAAVSRLRSVA